MFFCFLKAVWGVMVGVMIWGSVGENLADAEILFEDVRLDHAVGTGTRSPVIRDFNGDGKPDVAVANSHPSNDDVSVLLGNGDGTFKMAVDYPLGKSPNAVAVGDLNGDNRPDLVSANTGSNDVSVLLGIGDGTFRTAIHYPAGEVPWSLAVGDLNGDGRPDLAVANLRSNDVSLLLGNGDGTFQTARNLSIGNGPASVAIEDLNGNGRLDLIVVINGADTVSVLLGNGDATFQTAVSYPTGHAPQSVSLGDLNGDGKKDLVVPNLDSSDASIFLGRGDGTFSTSTLNFSGVDAPIGLWNVSIGDLNEDGRNDLVFGAVNWVYVMLGRGDGTFENPMADRLFNIDEEVALADLNGDGHLDLAVSSLHMVSVLLGYGDGTFFAGPPIYPVGAGPSSMVLGDLNGDRRLDVATANSSGSASVLLGNGDGTLRKARDFIVGSEPVSIALADLNGDGGQDLATANQASSDVSVLLGNGYGTFLTAVNIPTGPYPVSLAIADLNGDGRLDVVTADRGPSIVDDYFGSFTLLFGKGDGNFQSPVKYTIDGVPRALAIADFNGDERPDVAVAHNRGSIRLPLGDILNFGSDGVSVFLNGGNGTFQSQITNATIDPPGSLAVNDLNGDGWPDLAVGKVSSLSISVLLGNGDGTFQASMDLPTDFVGIIRGVNLAIGDVDGDERADLVAHNGDLIAVFLGNGDGTFLTPTWGYGIPGGLLSDIVIGDMNGDGRKELVVAKSGSDVGIGGSAVTVLLTNGTLPQSTPGAMIALQESPTFVYPSTLLEIVSSPVYAATSGCDSNEMEVEINLGPYEEPVDLYVALTQPDGKFLILGASGDLTTEIVPYLSGVIGVRGREVYRKLVFSSYAGLTVPRGWWALNWLILPSSGNGLDSIDWRSSPYEYGRYYFYVPTLSAQWSEMDGVMAQVSAGSAEQVWGVSRSGFVFERNGDQWEYAGMDGSPRISAGCDGTVLALFRADGRLLEIQPLDPANPFDLSRPKWNPVLNAPDFVDISVGNSSDIWGVTSAGTVFRQEGDEWVQVEGTLSHVSVGCDGTVWGVDSTDRILKWLEGTWQVIPGELKQISVGCAGVVWGVDTAGRIYMRENDEWIPIEGELQQISAACDGTVRGVNSYNQVFRVDSVCPYRP